MKGRVVICKEYNKPFVIEEFEVPALEPGAILLRMVQSGICGSDLPYWRGDQVNPPLPPTGRVMGHEGYGVIHSLGREVSTDSLGAPLHEGDRVVYTAIFPCNHCHMCLKGATNLCVNRPVPAAGEYPYFTGTYADYLYLPPGHPVFGGPQATLAPSGVSPAGEQPLPQTFTGLSAEDAPTTGRVSRGLTAMLQQRGGRMTMRLDPPAPNTEAVLLVYSSMTT